MKAIDIIQWYNMNDVQIIQADCLDYMKTINITIDLIYIDPPFGDNATDKIFGLKWCACEAELSWFYDFFGKSVAQLKQKHASVMAHYLKFMYDRLVLMRELLADNGSIYVHLDYRVGHYVKVIIDEIFGKEQFRNEIAWIYARPAAPNQRIFNRAHSIIFFYSKTEEYPLNLDSVRIPYTEATRARAGYMSSAHGRRFVREIHAEGKIPEDWWDIPYLRPNSKENIDFPTQKPEALLGRIIKASSNEGDLVADFFCGSGTTIAVAKKLGRKAIGVDIRAEACKIAADRIAKITVPPKGFFHLE